MTKPWISDARQRASAKYKAVHELILLAKGTHGGSAQSDLCAKTLAGIEKWTDDEMVRSYLRPVDLSEYLIGNSQKKKRLLRAA